MLSRESEQKIRQHMRLAKGFLETASVGAASSEFEERNALSRAYYAMFHASCAWVALKFGITHKLSHRDLINEMHRRRGKDIGDFIRDLRGMRESADYGEDWTPQRLVSEDRIRKARTQVLLLCAEIEAGTCGIG